MSGVGYHAGRRLIPAPALIAVRPRGLSGLGVLQGGQASAANIAATGANLTGTLVKVLADIPVAGQIASGIVQLGLAIANAFSGCGQTCVQATTIANQVGDQLTENLNQYMSAPVHYASLQAAALNNFTTAWNALVSACEQTALGAAGQRCITDRQEGACTWKASPGGWVQASDGSWSYTPWGASGSGSSCWNWFIGLHDPIANDPTVVPDPSSISSAVSSVSGDLSSGLAWLQGAGSIMGIPMSLIIPAALLAVAAMAFSD